MLLVAVDLSLASLEDTVLDRYSYWSKVVAGLSVDLSSLGGNVAEVVLS